MGMREWYWGSGRSSKRGRGGGGGPAEKDMTTSSGCMCAVFQLFDFHQLQLANLHHPQQPSFNTFHQEDLTVPKGVEAPRNSLDSSEGTSLSSTTKEEENLNSPILKFQMGMQIKTSGGGGRTSSADFSSDISSPGTKTPNLVARLMGLDLLPDQIQSPSSTSSCSSTTTHATSKSKVRTRKALQSRPRRHVVDMSDATNTAAAGTRSLPETPRISSARRSDVDLHHRLSLQINKENVGVGGGEELDFCRSSSYKRRDLKMINFGDHENVKSPSHYARQIVKQVRESVSRKVGLDITNTTRPVNKDKQGRDELLHQLKSKNGNAASKSLISKEDSSASCSPRLRFLDPKTTTTTPASLTAKDQIQPLPPKPKSPLSSLPPKPKPVQQPLKEEKQQQQQKSQTSIQKRRKSAHKQQEEAFVSPSTATRAIHNNIPADKKCKKTQLLSSNNVPTIFPIKKDPSPPATKIPQKQAQQQVSESDAQQSKRRWSQLSSSTSQTYKQQQEQQQMSRRTPHELATREIINMLNGGATSSATASGSAGGAAAEAELIQYLTRILSRTGIDKDTQVSFTNWFSPSHPLDPSIFHHLENSNVVDVTGQLGQRCNRKLMFRVVDEILVEILRPYINMKPWVATSSNNIGMWNNMNGSELVNILCHKIQSFPCADCQVLEDIDDLIDKDMPAESKVQSEMAFEEEGEGIVREVEKDILDTLIHETARVLWF
ncbi:hypothetical protein PRUPE_2G287400 [Prunus persica]|uniref:DUF4378 domain-containing protein n=1 Tax=Prunus persica TaxID=3760 RepID=A0A251QN07_PRUPE|nr:uncharacterized protein LOC18784966 isoform X2 [Prunus persica]ONI25191.1 hypothetical protein PRUPE_2G287400 [Prunus persica]